VDLDRTSAQRKTKSKLSHPLDTAPMGTFPLCWSELFQCLADIADEFAEQKDTVTIDIINKHCPIHRTRAQMVHVCTK